jgi:chromosome segregation ATPase
MDQDQLIKQVEWLDKERREEKKVITALQKKVAELEKLLDKSHTAIKESNSEITRLNVIVDKVDQFEGVMEQHRTSVKKEMDAHEKRAKKREQTAKKNISEDVDKLRSNLTEFNHEVDKIRKLSKLLGENKDADIRRDQAISEIKQQRDSLQTEVTEAKNAIQIIQEERQTNHKRSTDLAGEVSALRNKLDEMRGQQQLITENHRKTDSRLSELIATEDQRRADQSDHLESLARENERRGKTWKLWEKRFSDIEKQAEAMTLSLQSYSEAERAVQKAQQDLENITEQINRRIHEITEMQRLGEERFRQEWSTFKADDQKRWANYALTQDEQTKENSRRFERLSDRATSLEELTQDLQDLVQHTNEQSEKLIQTTLASMRDWLASTERYTDSIS